MNAKLEKFLSDLRRLEPADGDFLLEQKLYELVDTLEGVEDASPAFRHIFEFFERFPNAEHGSPGPLVHLVELFGPAYFADLVHSLGNRPTPHTLWMLNRILNSKLSAPQRAKFMALLEASTRHPLADAIAREQASGFLQHQQNRAT
jgi:hypothetical protein